MRNFRTGDIITRLLDDVGTKLAWYLCSGIFRVFEAAAIIVFGVAMMLSISPSLTLAAAGPLPLLVIFFIVTANPLHTRYDRVQQTISDLNSAVETTFSGLRVVKTFAAERLQQRAVFAAIDAEQVAEVSAVRAQSVLDLVFGNVWQLGIIGVLLLGGPMVIEGTLTLGDLVAFDAYVLLLVWPMFDIGQFLVRGA